MIVEDSKDLSAYEVVGPNGEYYGRYDTRPGADKIPLYAMVKEVAGLGQEESPNLVYPKDPAVPKIIANQPDPNIKPWVLFVLVGAAAVLYTGAIVGCAVLIAKLEK